MYILIKIGAKIERKYHIIDDVSNFFPNSGNSKPYKDYKLIFWSKCNILGINLDFYYYQVIWG